MPPIGGTRSEFLQQSVVFGAARDQSPTNLGKDLSQWNSMGSGAFNEGLFQFSAEVGPADQRDDRTACERDTHQTSFVPKDPRPLTKGG